MMTVKSTQEARPARSPAQVGEFFASVCQHLRMTGWTVKLSINEDFMRINSGRWQKRIPADAAAEYSDILATMGSVKLAVSVGRTANAEQKERALARQNGYRYFNACEYAAFRSFLNNIK